MDIIKVRCADGRDCLTEDGKEWPKKPVEVEKTLYIRRRLAAGDLVEVSEKKTSTELVTTKGDKK